MTTMDYLREPSLEGHRYGVLTYDASERSFCITGEPLLLEYAKRLFPGARISRGGGGSLRFNHSRREVADLNWLLMRFPMDVSDCADVLSSARDNAIEEIQRRVSGDDRTRTTPPSEFVGQLYPYQESAVTFLTTNRRAVLADGMGLGKTWSTLAAAAVAGSYPVLIVCQAHVQRQWQRMIGRLFDLPAAGQVPMFASEFSRVTARGQTLAPLLRGRTPEPIKATPFAVTHYGLLADWKQSILDHGFRTVIFDEIQELRHTGTAKYSAASLISERAEYVWGASGTPVYGYGAEIWSVMNAVDFHCLGSKEAFSREWCSGYGGRMVVDPMALNGHLSREGLLLRRRATDQSVALDLPRVARRVATLQHDAEIYEDLIGAARQMAKLYDRASYTTKGQLAREIDAKTRRASGVAKAQFVGEFVAAACEAGEVPLVYAWHHDVHDTYRERLADYSPAVFTGRQTTAQKDRALKRFIDGQAGCALLSLRSAAGLDGLQGRATTCIFGELDWAPAVHSQCETRIARIGVDELLDEVPSHYCVSDVGHDQIMLDVLGVKTGQFTGLMGDEPESYEEQQEAERRAAARIRRLVRHLQGEEAPLG
ncbi:MAG: DEAD/DEAH box helicase [bacterium]|nr:DEAD/DEAH box helicase [bacterium]